MPKAKLTKNERDENKIMRKTIAVLIAAGYFITVDYGGGDEGVVKSQDAAAIFKDMKATDIERLYVYKTAEGGKGHNGWIQFVYGNSGYEVIQDYTTNLEEVLKPVNELIEEIEATY